MKSKVLVSLSRDQKKLMDKAADLWATVNESPTSRVLQLVLAGQKTDHFGLTFYYQADGGIATVLFILNQLINQEPQENPAHCWQYQVFTANNPDQDYQQFLLTLVQLRQQITEQITNIK
jgi:hypothetical protein